MEDNDTTIFAPFGFNLTKFWELTVWINGTDPDDPRLYTRKGGQFYNPKNPSLTHAACTAIAGKSYNLYDGETIWVRCTTWKFPLLQLVASFPRPPLGLSCKILVILHLMGDPIDTIGNLIFKLSKCQKIAVRAQRRLEEKRTTEGGDQVEEERRWKAWSLVVDAYEEWGRSRESDKLMHYLLDGCQDQDVFWDHVKAAAHGLSADRDTRYFPTSIAVLFFILTFFVAIVRLVVAVNAGRQNRKLFINLEMHSVAFSSLYLWIIPTVFLGSVIGVSQTEYSIPRILFTMHKELRQSSCQPLSPARAETLKALEACMGNEDRRQCSGGIYSWQPGTYRVHIPKFSKSRSYPPVSMNGVQDRQHLLPSHTSPQSRRPRWKMAKLRRSWGFLCKPFKYWWSLHPHSLLPHLIVGFAAATAALVSSLVPPGGFECRVIGELGTYLAWILSSEMDLLLYVFFYRVNSHEQTYFWVTFAKDLIFTCGTLGWVTATIFGVLNRCGCYTQWGTGALALPQRSDIDEILRRRLRRDYPALFFGLGIATQFFVFPALICYLYFSALRVFVQRDDGGSNLKFWETQKTDYNQFRIKEIKARSPTPEPTSEEPSSQDAAPLIATNPSGDVASERLGDTPPYIDSQEFEGVELTALLENFGRTNSTSTKVSSDTFPSRLRRRQEDN